MGHLHLLMQASAQDPGGWAKVLESLADLVRAASNNPFGILALALVCVAVWIYAVRREGTSPAWPTHALGLVAILALAGGALEMYFRNAGLESRDARLKALQTDLDAAQQKLARPYDMTFKLLFPEGQLRDPFTPEVEVWVKKRGEQAATRLGAGLFQDIRGEGGINVEVPQLSPGDKVFITLRERQGIWRSDDVRLPEAQLRMNPPS